MELTTEEQRAVVRALSMYRWNLRRHADEYHRRQTRMGNGRLGITEQTTFRGLLRFVDEAETLHAKVKAASGITLG